MNSIFSGDLIQVPCKNKFDILGINNEDVEGVIADNDCRSNIICRTTYRKRKKNVGGTRERNRLKCICFNARSIVNKQAELELLVHDENPDLIAITETWLRADIEDNEISLGSYSLFRKDRLNARGGGVLIYIRETLKPSIREDLTSSEFEESLWIEIKDKNESTIIGVCYRNPTSSVDNDDKLFSLIEKCTNDTVLLMGDFNLGDTNWNTYEAKGQGKLFVDCLTNHFFNQHVDLPTRKKNILDLVLSNEENIVQNLEVGEEFGSSDHQIIKFDLVIGKDHSKPISKFLNFHKADYENIRLLARDIGLGECVLGEDVIADWQTLKTKILDIQETLIPKVNRSNRKCKWVTRRTIKCRRAKKKHGKNTRN